MRYATYRDRSNVVAAGMIEGESIQPFADGLSLYDFIASDESARGRARAALGAPLALSEVSLLAPLRPRKNIFCVGRNYLAHAEEGARALGTELKLPSVPTFFTKAPTSIADPGTDLYLDPTITAQYDFEAELAVVIGRRVRDVAEADALGVIFGYTCLNDVTARDVQRAHVQWFKGKSLDDTCPIGPWVVDATAVGDPQALDIRIDISGEEKQRASTAAMIFSVARIIAELSRGMTLEPGDIIATGTPEGVGFARTPPEFLRDGDTMTVEIEKIGSLHNTVRLGKR